MALKRIGWENGTLVESAKVLADGTVQPAQYEGSTPLSAANLEKMEDNTEEFVNELVGTLENLDTTAKNNLVSAINELFNKSNVVYDKKLESAQTSVNIPCDILADGGAYEFTFIIYPNNTSKSSDYKLRFNDSTSLSYACVNFQAVGNLTGEGSMTVSANYRGFHNIIGDYWGSANSKQYPVVLEGKIKLIDDLENESKKLFVETKFNAAMHAQQRIIFHSVLSVDNITNLTKINMVQSSNDVSNYGVGSRFILKKTYY